jgi:hypothetical protein
LPLPNCASFKLHVSMSHSPSDTPRFYYQELSTAIGEQKGRLEGYEGLAEVDKGATARVHTLEGEWLVVALTLRGYQVRIVAIGQ